MIPMASEELKRILTCVVLASISTLSATACSGVGERTYVISNDGAPSCEQACSKLRSHQGSGDIEITDVKECTEASLLDVVPDAGTDGVSVTVCRMETLYTGGIGRRPEGCVGGHVRADTEEGALFARMAYLEAASVLAFRRLARELRAHGAPSELVAGARSSARDEIRHARVASRWRDRFGGEAMAMARVPTHVRALAEVVRENAIEGCVHETWGAIVAATQALRAPDAELRADLSAIAADEAEHAALAWAIDGWARSALDPDEMRAIDKARAAAAASLRSDVERETERAGAAGLALGLPDRALAVALLARATDALPWRA